MDNYKLVETFSEFKEFKNIDREAMMRIIEDVFRGMLNKKFETDTDDFIDIIVNVDKGDFEIYHNRTVVEDDELTDPLRQIKLSDAIKIEPDFEVGEEVNEELRIEKFGRRDILALRQNLQTKVSEYEKENIFQKYKEKVGEIITAEVLHAWKREIVVQDDEGIELIMPRSEQIPTDIYKKGDTVRAIVKSVDSINGSPVVTLSRTSEVFLQRLLEAEVPEIYDGLITVKKIVREPGQRAKIAVESYDDRVDPVGACVGMKGTRIHGIVRELRNENIDVLQWTSNTQLLIQRALNPARVSSIDLGNSPEDKIKVYMQPDEVKKGIGRGGCNIKLAGMLVGREIEVWRELSKDEIQEEEDVLLSEFNNEIDQWVIDRLEAIGCDTAKSVLAFSPEDIARRADLEDETVAEVFRILKAEFED